MYLKSVVRVNTAPAALLQLHLRVKIFLVLLHYVGQVRAPAALCVVLFTVTVVLRMVLRENRRKLKGSILEQRTTASQFYILIFILVTSLVLGYMAIVTITKEMKESVYTLQH